MPTINEYNPRIDQTVQIFDAFYDYSENVPSQEYDIVLSYFESVVKTKRAAENLTVTLFRIAQETRTDVLTLLQSMQGQSQIELSLTMAYYLNQLRSPATLLGVLEPTVPNFYTARNVRQ